MDKRTKRTKRAYIVDVLEIHTVSVMATSAADAKKRVDAGEGDIAADVFDEWADKARIQR